MGIEHITITVISGADDGKVFKLDKMPITLGRSEDDNIHLPYDTRCSRNHARISEENGKYFIEDVGPEGKGSRNGTYVNNAKISGKTPVSSGEKIFLGGVWIRFETKGTNL